MTAAELRFRVEGRREIADPRRESLTERLSRPAPLVLWFLLHIGIAELARSSTGASRIHFTLATIICLVAAVRARTLNAALVPVFYCLSLDVFWRMTGTVQPWEGAKYMTIILSGIAIIRFVGRPHRATLPLVYLACLIPAIYPTLFSEGFGTSREQIFFYLAGPVAFVTLGILCGEITIRWSELEKLLWIMLGPMVAATYVATHSTQRLTVSDFQSLTSNADSSGGFGPNQVSAVLSLGSLLCLLIVLRERRIHLRLIAGGIALWMAGQSALTFSRGGLVNLLVAMIIVVPALLMHRTIGPRLIVTVAIGALIVGVLIIPGLETFTGNSLGARFASRELTGRAQLSQIDVGLFENSLPWGVGVSQADAFHSIGDHNNVASHNEYTRLLAEHGLLGIGAMIALGAFVLSSIARQPGNLGRAWSGGLSLWGLTELSHSSTRIAVGMGVLALAALRIIDDGIDEPVMDEIEPRPMVPLQPRPSVS